MGNAEIGSYLTHLGLRIEAIRFITQAPPNSVSLLTPEIARGLGIEVFEQSGANITTPAAKPTVDTLATLTALFAGMANNCASLFEIPASDLKAATGDAVKQGNAVAGAETFVRLMLRNIDEVKTEISSNGPINWCLIAEARLRKIGVDVLPKQPSFDCTKAKTSSELKICQSPDLIASDRATLSLYRAALRVKDGGDQRPIKVAQRQWILMREACAGDEQCLRSAYQMRIQQLAKALQ